MSKALLWTQVDYFALFYLFSAVLIPTISGIKILCHFDHLREKSQKKTNKKSETRNKKRRKARTYHYRPVDIGRMNPEGFLMFSEVMLPHRYCTKWYGTKWQDYKCHKKATTHTSEFSFLKWLKPPDEGMWIFRSNYVLKRKPTSWTTWFFSIFSFKPARTKDKLARKVVRQSEQFYNRNKEKRRRGSE